MARILIVGHKGQLGQTLMAVPNTHELIGIDLPEHDITDAADVIPSIAALAPDAVINPAAFTNVDAAEANPYLAYRVNAHGAGNIARACHLLGIPMIQISTNEVFDGTRVGQPYDEWDQANATSTYARSKLAGENAVRFYHDNVLIVRIAWLFAPGGNNFPGKICEAADKHGALKVVDDEFGNPTYAPDLARALFVLLEQHAPPGIYHITNGGSCQSLRIRVGSTAPERTRAHPCHAHTPHRLAPTQPAAVARPPRQSLRCRPGDSVASLAGGRSSVGEIGKVVNSCWSNSFRRTLTFSPQHQRRFSPNDG